MSLTAAEFLKWAIVFNLYNGGGSGGPGGSSLSGVRVASTGNLTATYLNGSSGVGATLTNSSTQAALVIDGVTLAVGNRVLVKSQTTTFQNGVYTVTNVGSVSTNWVLTRALDFDTSASIVVGAYTAVAQGTANAGEVFVQSATGPVVVGTDAITFVSTSGLSPLNISYVALNGNNVSGSGAFSNPYADPYAATVAISGSTSNPKVISIAPGTYTGGTGLNLKPLVSYLLNNDSVIMNLSPTGIGLDSSWSAASNGSYVFFQNGTVSSAAILDFTTLTASGCSVIFKNTTVTGSTIIAGPAANQLAVTATNTNFNSVLNLQSVNSTLTSCVVGAGFTITPPATNGNSTLTAKGCTFSSSVTLNSAISASLVAAFQNSSISGNVSIDGTGSLAVTMTGCRNAGSITINGSSPTLLIDSVSRPELGFIFTGGATAAQITMTPITTSPVANCFVGWDANKNISANNSIGGLTTIVTAAGTTVLTVASTYVQQFTGTTTQIVQLPDVTTLAPSFPFYIINNSTGVVTVTSSGGNTVITLPANSTASLTCLLTTGTTAASWEADAIGAGTDLFPNGSTLVTNSTQTIVNGTVYLADASGIVTFTLPGASPGSFFAIVGINGWKLNMSSGQAVTIGNITANGSSVANWQSSNVSDAVIFLCTGSNAWQSVSLAGNPVTSQGVTALATNLMPKVTVTGSTQAMSPNTSYFCNAGASLITYTLPITLNSIASSTRVAVYGQTGGSAGGWKITYGAGVQILFGNNLSTATTGNIQSTTAGDWVVLDYIGGNWQVTACGGAPKLDTGGSVNGLSSVNNGVLVTSASGVQSISTTLPSGIAATSMALTTPALGTPASGDLSNCTNLPIGNTFSAGLNGPTTLSATPVMNGFAVTNAVKGTHAVVTFCGQFFAVNAATNTQVAIRYGTGTAPVSGAAVTGTQAGTVSVLLANNTANTTLAFSKTTTITGLTPGTTYWFDMQVVQAGTGNTQLQNVDATLLSF